MALFLGVWVIYLFDRLLDVSRAISPELLPQRHGWTRDHFRLIVFLEALALVLLFALVLPRLERTTVIAGAIPGLLTLLYYLIFRFRRPVSTPRRLPFKEMTIALCFALGIVVAAGEGVIGRGFLVLSGGLVLLLLGNCLLIARSESTLDSRNDPSACFANAAPGQRKPRPEVMSILAMMTSVPLLISGSFPLSSPALLICSGLTFLLARSEGKAGAAFTQAKADGILMIPLLLAILRMTIIR